jgi:hypothetical protein
LNGLNGLNGLLGGGATFVTRWRRSIVFGKKNITLVVTGRHGLVLLSSGRPATTAEQSVQSV